MNMNFIFEQVLTPDSETFNVKIKDQDIGTVFKDKQKEIWAAIPPNSQLREPQVFKTKQLAAEHLAKKAGLV